MKYSYNYPLKYSYNCPLKYFSFNKFNKFLKLCRCLIHAQGTTKQSESSFTVSSWQDLSFGLLFVLTQVFPQCHQMVAKEIICKI